MKALKDFFNKNKSKNEAHKQWVARQIENFKWTLQSEIKTWESSSEKSKHEYTKTAEFLTENVPVFYKDVTFEYFKKCVVIANINYSCRNGSPLPEPKEYDSFFNINYYGNFLSMFRPVLEESRRGAFKHIGGGIYQDSYYPYEAMNEFVNSNWNTFLGRECRNHEENGRMLWYAPERKIAYNVDFVKMKHLLQIVGIDSEITAEQYKQIIGENE